MHSDLTGAPSAAIRTQDHSTAILHPDYQRMPVACIQGNARLNYIERIMHLALFFFELAEEDTNGHSRVIRDQLPATGMKWSEVQRQFREVWYGSEELSLTDAALRFHQWVGARIVLPLEWTGLEEGIRAACLPYERPFQFVTESLQQLDRNYVRLARFYRRMVREDITQHTRTVERFVSNATVPQNQGRPEQHPEHVVPCKVLRDMAMACFRDHWSVREVADLLRRLLVVIWIEQEHRIALDHGESNLKNRMPEGWDRDRDCLYMRLHEKAIAFLPAAGIPCTCTVNDGDT